MAELYKRIDVDQTTSKLARDLSDWRGSAAKVLSTLDDLFARISGMKQIGSDGTQASHFALAATSFAVQAESGGFTANEKAKKLYDELNAAAGGSDPLRQLIGEL